MSYRKVFRRDEKKYLLSEQQQKSLLKLIRPHIEPDRYFESTNCSLYFDTKNQDLIINSIEKPLFKQKIRLRSYGIPSLKDTVFLENKIKYRGVVNKRRIGIKLADFYQYYNSLHLNHDTPVQEALKQNNPTTHPLNSDTPQISRELDYFFRFYDLRPAWFIAYDRQSYCEKGTPSLRITFDQNLRSRTDNLRLELGDNGKRYFTDQTCIMEIKSLDAMPRWPVTSLSQLQIYPVSFTKYGK